MQKIKRTQSITFKFMSAFIIVTAFILVFTGIFTYKYQILNYNKNIQKNMRIVCKILSDSIIADEENFLAFEKYMMEHSQEIIIDPEFDNQDYMEDRIAFYKVFDQKYPSKVYGTHIKFDEMDDDLKKMYVKWYQEFWILRFEDMMNSFSLPFIYFTYPTGEGSHVIYIIDFQRTIDEKYTDNRLLLWDNYEEDPNEIPVMFKVWDAGHELDEFEICNNEYGYNYSYYLPVYLKGEKAGLIGVDASVEKVNREIMSITIGFIVIISLTIITGLFVFIIYIKKNYVERLVRLNKYIEEYARERDVNIVKKLQKEMIYGDEIDSVIWRIISMIRQIQIHLNKILEISRDLGSSQEQIEKLTKLSEKDNLTGLGNKLAYSRKEAELNYMINDSDIPFAIIMIDLNYLKKINDYYGHDKGDVALKEAALYLKEAFTGYNIYRIGGDEFIVLAETIQQIKEIDDHLKILNDIQDQKKDLSDPWLQISLAYGYCIFDADKDKTVEDVFIKADGIMYEMKKNMKAERKG